MPFIAILVALGLNNLVLSALLNRLTAPVDHRVSGSADAHLVAALLAARITVIALSAFDFHNLIRFTLLDRFALLSDLRVACLADTHLMAVWDTCRVCALCAPDLVTQVSTTIQKQLTFITDQSVARIANANLCTNSVGTLNLDLSMISASLDRFTVAIDQCISGSTNALLNAILVAFTNVYGTFAARARYQDFLSEFAYLNRHTMVVQQCEARLADTGLFTVVSAGTGSRWAVALALDLLDLIVTALLDPLALIIDECVAGFANTHLLAAAQTVTHMTSTIRALCLRNLCRSALKNWFTGTTNSRVTVLANACWMTIVLEAPSS